MSAEGIESARNPARERSEAFTRTTDTAQERSGAPSSGTTAALVAALARAAAAAADAGDLERARALLDDAKTAIPGYATPRVSPAPLCAIK
jgi:hypothetical protein